MSLGILTSRGQREEVSSKGNGYIAISDVGRELREWCPRNQEKKAAIEGRHDQQVKYYCEVE